VAPNRAPDAATLAKYDTNRNGVLDAAEQAALDADMRRSAGAASSSAVGGTKADEDIISLSPFEVISDNKGYYGANTMSGTRFNTKLEDLASSITVMTKEQMSDFAMLDINDVFLYDAPTKANRIVSAAVEPSESAYANAAAFSVSADGRFVAFPGDSPLSDDDYVADLARDFGYPLPSLLRRLYLEVGNGGFGPGYGIFNLPLGEEHKAWPSLSPSLFPMCDWGCAILSFVDCADAEATMWGWDPNPAPHDDLDKALFREDVTLCQWLARWVSGELYQPVLVQDPKSGAWRSATHEEKATWMNEF
jgi:hypothetical protein